MKTLANIALGVIAGCAVCSLIIHRNVVKAMVKGEPLPQPPAWHVWHKGCDKA